MIKSVFITGGNSGIGLEIALYYARKGAHIGIAARREELSHEAARKCKDSGAQATVYKVDVTDGSELRKAAEDFISQNKTIDLVVANAGVSSGDHLTSGDPSRINFLLKTNIIGVTNTVYPFIPSMISQGFGKIAIIGSMASSRGLPGKGGYSASKRALRTLAESWRISLKKEGVSISVFSPGFIDTPFIKKNKYPMPFMISAADAAAIIVKAVENGKKHLIFPWQWRLLYPLISILPDLAIGLTVNKKKYSIDQSESSV